MDRRTFLENVAWSAAALNLDREKRLEAKPGFTPTIEPSATPTDTIVVENDNHRMEFVRKTGQLLSLRANAATDQEFVKANDRDPVFVIQYLDHRNEFRQIPSTQASETTVRFVDQPSSGSSKAGSLTADFHGLSGLDLSVTVTVRTVANDPYSYWSIALNNRAALLITDVQFPFIVVSYRLAGSAETEALVRPLVSGQLLRAPKPWDFEPDSPHAWQFRPENTDSRHYPGETFAQFLAYYNDRAGVMTCCQDSSGAIKIIKPLHHGSGIRLGISHVGDWPKNGERQLEYIVAVRTFTGDWYAAAELYRQWSLTQPWAQKPLHRRTDVSDWLLDSPSHIIIQAAGLTDLGPGDPNVQFLPYPKLVPLLETISNRVGAPVVALLMSWERPGPWVYPDCFPPVGGEQSFREFAQLARDREWHVGSYANGTRWVIAQLWTGYDGEKYFEEQGGEKTICRTHQGQGWRDNWDWSWRPSYACCLGVPMTREIAVGFVKHLVDDGLDWIQFLDQNVGCATFPCYASDHGHPPTPGRWMTLGMQALLDAFRKLAVEAKEQTQGKRKLAFSVERPPNEYFMPNFQICDARARPPGHPGYERDFIPLYHFLYHEFILIHGGFAFAPMPYNMPIRSAYNLVVGEIPGGVLTGDGRLLNRDTEDYGPWDPAYGNFDDDLAMLRTATALRRGKARNFLVYGRMQSPPSLSRIKSIEWRWEKTFYQVPAVFHAAWQSPEERYGIVLANWTKDSQPVSIMDGRLGERVLISVSSGELKSQTAPVKGGRLETSLPPLSCALVEDA